MSHVQSLAGRTGTFATDRDNGPRQSRFDRHGRDRTVGDWRPASLQSGRNSGDVRQERLPAPIHISLLVDASGSMEASRKPAVAAVNRYLARLDGGPASARTRISITFFNSHAIETIRDRAAAGACPFVREDEYRPGGRTPLRDAITYSASLLDCLSATCERRALAILTDGDDTASRSFSAGYVKALLEANQRQRGWVVAYIGIDHDSMTQGRALGVQDRWIGNISRTRFAAAADLLSSVSHPGHGWARSQRTVWQKPSAAPGELQGAGLRAAREPSFLPPNLTRRT